MRYWELKTKKHAHETKKTDRKLALATKNMPSKSTKQKPWLSPPTTENKLTRIRQWSASLFARQTQSRIDDQLINQSIISDRVPGLYCTRAAWQYSQQNTTRSQDERKEVTVTLDATACKCMPPPHKNAFGLALDLDLWPWKPFRQWSLT